MLTLLIKSAACSLRFHVNTSCAASAILPFPASLALFIVLKIFSFAESHFVLTGVLLQINTKLNRIQTELVEIFYCGKLETPYKLPNCEVKCFLLRIEISSGG